MSDLEANLTAPNGVKYTQPLGLFINNEWVKPKAGDKIESIHPTDESPITSVWAAGAEDVDVAVAATALNRAIRHTKESVQPCADVRATAI